MAELMVPITILSFVCTILFIFYRPHINVAIPASCGALLVLLSQSVSPADLIKIGETISGASITIIATIVMATVLESIGFFYWAGEQLIKRAKGSGIRLFWYTNLLCFLMTLFFNNDGSILITTPILILLLKNLRLKNEQKIPYLLSGALIATASSAPIGVSNIVNLIALKIIGLDLYLQTEMMFVPATLGLLLLSLLLYANFYQNIPRKLPQIPKDMWLYAPAIGKHPLREAPHPHLSQSKLMRNILIFVFTVRASLFLASYLQFPVYIMAVIGSVLLLSWRWAHFKIPPADMFKKTPWHILLFAFSMYVIIYGLNNIGLTHWLAVTLQPLIVDNPIHASLTMGSILTLMSNLFNNHPALMIGTLTLTNMGLDPLTVKIAYLANVIGSDIGSLILPIGTLATLIWMHLLKQERIHIHWGQYLKVTVIAIPITLFFTLTVLYYWVNWFF